MADVAASLKDWSITAASNSPSDSTTVGAGLADNFQQIQATVRAALAHKGSDIASATTTDLGAVAGLFHDITGTTTITGFGTVSAGIWKVIKFEGALTLTHNASSLILPGGANITTADGDIAIFVSEGSGNWRCVSYVKAGIVPWTNTAATTDARGTVELATTAETLAGTDTDRAVTAGGFAGSKDLSASGYYKLPGGLIIQWGSVSTDGNGDGTWTYPTAFASAVYTVQGTSLNGDAALTVSLTVSGTTSCSVYTRNHSDTQVSISVSMFAIGV